MSSTALESLQIAENEVCEIMKVAEDTLQELQNLPKCDHERLTELSTKYMMLIKSVYNRISDESFILNKNREEKDDENYTITKENEIFESLKILSETDTS